MSDPRQMNQSFLRKGIRPCLMVGTYRSHVEEVCLWWKRRTLSSPARKSRAGKCLPGSYKLLFRAQRHTLLFILTCGFLNYASWLYFQQEWKGLLCVFLELWVSQTFLSKTLPFKFQAPSSLTHMSILSTQWRVFVRSRSFSLHHGLNSISR